MKEHGTITDLRNSCPYRTSERLQLVNSKERSLEGMPWDLKLQVLHMDDGSLSQTGERQWADLQWFGI